MTARTVVDVADRPGEDGCRVVAPDPSPAADAGGPALAVPTAAARLRLSVVYQVIVHADTGAAVGVEALARRRDRHGDPIPPAVFIPAAENSGEIAELGLAVLDTACAALAAWHTTPSAPPIGLAVNVSARQAELGDLAAQVLTTLARHALAPSQLTLELTESYPLPPGHPMHAALRTLRAVGAAVELDDVGAGNAGLDHLRRLPLTGIKIDRSLTRGLPRHRRTAAVASALVGLAADLGWRCVIEGVETPAHHAALPTGVHAQGWLYGRSATTLTAACAGLREVDLWRAT